MRKSINLPIIQKMIRSINLTSNQPTNQQINQSTDSDVEKKRVVSYYHEDQSSSGNPDLLENHAYMYCTVNQWIRDLRDQCACALANWWKDFYLGNSLFNFIINFRKNKFLDVSSNCYFIDLFLSNNTEILKDISFRAEVLLIKRKLPSIHIQKNGPLKCHCTRPAIHLRPCTTS